MSQMIEKLTACRRRKKTGKRRIEYDDDDDGTKDYAPQKILVADLPRSYPLPHIIDGKLIGAVKVYYYYGNSPIGVLSNNWPFYICGEIRQKTDKSWESSRFHFWKLEKGRLFPLEEIDTSVSFTVIDESDNIFPYSLRWEPVNENGRITPYSGPTVRLEQLLREGIVEFDEKGDVVPIDRGNLQGSNAEKVAGWGWRHISGTGMHRFK